MCCSIGMSLNIHPEENCKFDSLFGRCVFMSYLGGHFRKVATDPPRFASQVGDFRVETWGKWVKDVLVIRHGIKAKHVFVTFDLNGFNHLTWVCPDTSNCTIKNDSALLCQSDFQQERRYKRVSSSSTSRRSCFYFKGLPAVPKLNTEVEPPRYFCW